MKAWQLRHRKPCWCLTAASSNDHQLSSFKHQNYPLTVLKPECGSWGLSRTPAQGTLGLSQLLAISPHSLWHGAAPSTLPLSIFSQGSAHPASGSTQDLRAQAQSLGPALSQPTEADLTTSRMSRTSQTKVRCKRTVGSCGMEALGWAVSRTTLVQYLSPLFTLSSCPPWVQEGRDTSGSSSCPVETS